MDVRQDRTPTPSGVRPGAAFTIVELLVVVSVLAVLLAILLPSLSSARNEARRVSCAANLKQIGVGIRSYLDDYDDHLPYASWMPSFGPFPLRPEEDDDDNSGGGRRGGGFGPGRPPETPGDGTPQLPVDPETGYVKGTLFLADLLDEHLNHERRVFQCPGDQPGRINRPAPNEGKSYFESEKSSYEFRRGLWGQQYDRLSSRYERFSGRKVANNMIWIMRDYNNFHGDAGSKGSRRYLYVDGHVTDFEY